MFNKVVICLLLMCATVAIISAMRMRPAVLRNIHQLHSAKEMIGIFPTSVGEIERRTHLYIDDVRQKIDTIKQVPDEQRTFANTVKALDDATSLSDLAVFSSAVATIQYLHPNEQMRDAAQKMLSDISAFFVDIMLDKKLYQAFQAYAQGNMKNEQLTQEQKYYFDEAIGDFKRSGLNLPDEKLEQVKKIKKELTDLSLEFGKNIAVDQSSIEVDRSALSGLSDEFIQALKQTDDGKYILGVDYPTVFEVLENCTNGDTRKRLSIAFNNRAYPANENILKEIIAKRDELAKLLGFASYAHLNLDDQMVGSPEHAYAFIDNLVKRAAIKEQQEHEELKKELPESVTLDKDEKFYPWDVSFALQKYKKKHFDIDEQEIAEYFPVAQTIKGLLSIYEQFLSLRFKEVPAPGLWSDDVRMLEVYDAKDDQLLGRLLLDLYPRCNKYSHAAHLSINPTTYDADGKPTVGFSLVMANFPKAQGDKPPLFKRSDVSTFFHEFGHALHALLGRTKMASFSGTKVKRDFVELPSQMLEEWMYDKEILKMVSGHYKTGEPLPDYLIDNILKLKNLRTGNFVQRQGMLSKLALDYYAPGAQKDVNDIYKKLSQEIVQNIAYIPETHMFASFGHLTGYGPKYYGYLWSKVFALDMFDQIKKHGLLNPEIGQKYVDMVIGRGGSADPNELLRDFLGREPNDEAFFKDMGL
jgi:thimet oligopeptidase